MTVDIVNETIVTVDAVLPGAAPAQLETEVARKIENSVATLQGVKNVYTRILDGAVSVTVEFVLEKNSAEAVNEVRDAAILILDDLGTQNATPWAEEKLYQIFNIQGKLFIALTKQIKLHNF